MSYQFLVNPLISRCQSTGIAFATRVSHPKLFNEVFSDCSIFDEFCLYCAYLGVGVYLENECLCFYFNKILYINKFRTIV